MIRAETVSTRLRRTALGVLAAGSVLLTGCTDAAGYDLDYFWGNFDFLATLRGSVAYDAHEMPRLPVEGTVPVASPEGVTLPEFPQTALDSVAATLTNPLQPTAEVLSVGKRVYRDQCAVCHGPEGAGDGSVVGPGKFPFAPAVNGAAGTTPRSPGYVFAIISAGRGLMPPQGYKLTHTEQWAVTSYVEFLRTGRAAEIPVAPLGARLMTAPAAASPLASPATDTLTAAR